eukprot:8418641-Pyramimonas_sp.AAC.1
MEVPRARGPQEVSKRPPRGPKGPPRCPREAPRCPHEALASPREAQCRRPLCQSTAVRNMGQRSERSD